MKKVMMMTPMTIAIAVALSGVAHHHQGMDGWIDGSMRTTLQLVVRGSNKTTNSEM
jgi:hypothetical protein